MSDPERSFFNPELPTNPQLVLHAIVDTENGVIDRRNDAFYAANLFNTNALITAKMYDPWRPNHPMNSGYLKLDQQFRAEYALRQTAYERFQLFMDPRYFPYLDSLDLEKTRDARNPQILDHLVGEYQEIREALLIAGKITGELPRETSGREVHFRPPAGTKESENGSLDPVSEWSIGVRNRPLLRFRKGDYEVTITKRMTFAIPAKLAFELTVSETGEMRHDIHDAASMEYMEMMLDNNDPSITPIRTLYYVTKTKIKL